MNAHPPHHDGAAAPRAPRVIALDVFRGATIGAMILVNNPGSWSHVYAPLRHADWNGCTPTDLIFPFFLFIVGAAMAFSIGASRGPDTRPTGGTRLWARVARRAGVLVALGILLNAFVPVWHAVLGGAIDGLASIRLPGVLQRIGIVYALACVVVVRLGWRGQVGLAAALLGASTLAFVLFDPNDPFGPDRNAARALDRLLLPDRSLYTGSPTDPEGLLGTAAALVTTLTGYWGGMWVRAHRSRVGRGAIRMVLAGFVAVAAGLGASWLVPINKTLWTASYVLYTGGWGAIVLGVAWSACDRFAWPGRAAFALLGRHAIAVFVGSGVLARLMIVIPGPGDVTLKAWLYGSLRDIGLEPVHASLAFAVAMLWVWWMIAWGLDRAGLVWKV